MAEAAFNLNKIAANLITEDDEPVDNVLSEKNQRLLTEPLYSSWQPPPGDETPADARKFMAAANVGVFFSAIEPPLVPDVFVSLDVEPNAEWLADEHRSYFVWAFGKVPEVAVEIVSNRKGKEMDKKFRTYARWGINYYVVFDPFRELGDEALNVYEIGFGKRYRRKDDFVLPDLNLGLTLWRGEFEGMETEWLRWSDAAGNLILTGSELAQTEARRANTEARRADAETRRADAEARRADVETERAARLAAKLRALGVDPEQI